MKVAIVIPSALNSYMFDFVLSYSQMLQYLQTHIEDLPFEITHLEEIRPKKQFPIDANRNYAAARILEEGFDTSIWLDADQTFPINTLFRLLNTRDYPIVSGIYHVKAKPFYPVMFYERPDSDFTFFKPIIKYPDTYFYADMIGMGCVKIDRCVFEDIAKTYKDDEKIEFFRYGLNPVTIDYIKDDDDERRKKDAHIHAKYAIRDVSEDVFFCRLIREKTDYKIVIDPKIQSGHITSWTVDKDLCDGFYEQTMALIKERDPETHKYIEDNICQAEAIKKQD